MKISVAAVIAFVLLLAAVAAFAPATLLDRRVASVSDGKLRIADAQGTLWRGQGVLTDARGAWRIPIGWLIDPLAIARGTLAITLIPPEGATLPRGSASITEQSVAVRTLTIEVPANALAAGTPAGAAVTLGGDITIDAPSFDWNRERAHGTVTARWRGARVVSPLGGVDLGVIDATLAPEGTRLAGRLANAGGDVRIDGSLIIDAGKVRLDAAIFPLPGTPPQVARALALLGPADASGAVRVSWRNESR